MSTPKWLHNIVFYAIYPQSFMDSNSDGIGDIPGIIEKLDYIKDLGCDGIWMNPCFESPFFDAGYDVSNYKKVAPRYGTNGDMKRLFDEAHKRGMYVLLDLVPGHTSIYHKWFTESSKAAKNEFTDRYVWTDNSRTRFAPETGIRSSIHGFFERNGVCAVNFYSIQPALNYGFGKCTEPWMQPVDAPGPMATREAIKDIIRFWMSMGCDGFRVDLAGSLVKNDENQEATIALWQDFRRFMDAEFPNGALLAEWGNPERALRGGFHMDFLLPFRNSYYTDLFRGEHPYFSRKGEGDMSEFANYYADCCEKTNHEGMICIPSSSHDMLRIKDSLDDEEMGLAFAFLMSMPGAPFIYYGDEIGMRYLKDVPTKEGGYHRTGSRSPMQWDHSANAGFSCADPDDLYIMIDPDSDRPTVQDALDGKLPLYDEVKKLIALRKAHPALQNNTRVDFVYAEPNAYPLVYKRTAADEQVLVALNPSGRNVCCDIGVAAAKGVIYSNNGEATLESGRLTMPAASATFFML